MATIYFATGFETDLLVASEDLSNPDTEYFGSITGTGCSFTTRDPASGYQALTIASLDSVDYLGLHLANSSTRRLVGQIKVKRFTGPTGGNMDLLFVNGASTNNLARFTVTTAGVLTLTVAGGTAQTYGTLTLDTWYLLDFDLDVSTSSFTCNWRVNGTAQTQATNTGTAQDMANLMLGNSNVSVSVGAVHLDDLVLSKTGTDYPLTEMYVLGYPPSIDGTHSPDPPTSTFASNDTTDISSTNPAYKKLRGIGWTDHVYQYGGTSSNYLRLGFPNAPAAPVAVTAHYVVGTDGTSNAHSRGDLWDGTTLGYIWDGSQNFNYSTPEYGAKWVLFTQTPTSTAWSQANFNSIQYDVGRSTDYSPVPRMSAVWLEALFEGSQGLWARSVHTLNTTGLSSTYTTDTGPGYLYANRIAMAFIHLDRLDGSAVDVPSSVTGWGLTWERITAGEVLTKDEVTNKGKTYLYMALTGGTNPGSGSLTVTLGNDHDGANIAVIEVEGDFTAAANAADAVVQIDTVSDGSSSKTFTLSPAPDSASRCFIWANGNTGGGWDTYGGGEWDWPPLADLYHSTPTWASLALWRNDAADNEATVYFNSSCLGGGFILELAEVPDVWTPETDADETIRTVMSGRRW